MPKISPVPVIVIGAMLLAACGRSSSNHPASNGPDPATLPLVIKKAIYGHFPDGPTADVTQKVIAQASPSDVSMVASNILLGDPAVNLSKMLRVDFTSYGMNRVRWVDEDQRLEIHIPAGLPRLVIKKAVYGKIEDNKVTDVTAKVVEEAENDSLKIDATNNKFGDPDPGGWGKKLKIDYTYDGVEKSKAVAENETLVIMVDDKRVESPTQTKAN